MNRADIGRARDAARETLTALYERFAAKGQRPTAADFYPVALDFVVDSVLGWHIERMAQLGFTQDWVPIEGVCDYSAHIIRVATDGRELSAQNFTVAHEIGHALLHHDAASCSGVTGAIGLRTRASRVPSRPQPVSAREIEANTFASELLMPRKAVALYFESVFGVPRIWIGSELSKQVVPGNERAFAYPTIKQLASKLASYRSNDAKTLTEFFGVSTSAMVIRLSELRLVY